MAGQGAIGCRTTARAATEAGRVCRVIRPERGLCAGLAIGVLLAGFSLDATAADNATPNKVATNKVAWGTMVVRPAVAAKRECGKASWYGGKWIGGPTANGETYDPETMTAAHKTLKFGTRVRVTRPESGKSVVVRINNRGPFIKGRVIDLSVKAAKLLAFNGAGVVSVCIQAISK